MAGYQPTYANDYVPPPPPGWGQPQYQPPAYGPQFIAQQSVPPANGPPSKKQKGNPVITKYPPPPPGWKPTFLASGHQPPAASYELHQYAAPTSGGYLASQTPHPQLPSYQAPASLPHATYQADPSQGYQYDPNQAYQQPPYQPAQQYQQAQYFPPPVQSYQATQPYQSPHPYQSQPYQPQQTQGSPQHYQQVQVYAAPAVVPVAHPSPSQSGYYDVSGSWQPSQPPYTDPTSQLAASTYAASSFVAAAQSEHGHDQPRQPSPEYGDLDLDFDGEPISITDEIDPELSLGLIIWHPAVQRNRPLPATFKEAELEALAQAMPTNDEDESVSEYFVDNKKHEVELSIRQTAEWEAVKNDLIFVEFVETCDIVPLLTIIENRNRPDVSSEPVEPAEELSTQTSSIGLLPQISQLNPEIETVTDAEDTDGDQAMDISDDDEQPQSPRPAPRLNRQVGLKMGDVPNLKQEFTTTKGIPRCSTKVLDSLERALGPSDTIRNSKLSRPPSSARFSRSRSPEKMNRGRQGSQQPRAKPAPHPRDAAQESVLAALGVEGSPKMVYPTPPPALGPPVSPDRNGNRSPNRPNQPPNGAFHPLPPSLPYGPNFPPPPPPREARSPSFDPWKAHDAFHGNNRRSPSTTSQHTAAGSDFHLEDLDDKDATPRAKPPAPPPSHDRNAGPDSGRKRTFDRMAEPEVDKRRRQQDDTPRARRKPNYDRTDAYSRRW